MNKCTTRISRRRKPIFTLVPSRVHWVSSAQECHGAIGAVLPMIGNTQPLETVFRKTYMRKSWKGHKPVARDLPPAPNCNFELYQHPMSHHVRRHRIRGHRVQARNPWHLTKMDP